MNALEILGIFFGVLLVAGSVIFGMAALAMWAIRNTFGRHR